MAPARLAPTRLALTKLLRENSPSERSAPERSAPSKLTRRNSALTRRAPLRFAPVKSARLDRLFSRLAPERSAALKEVRTSSLICRLALTSFAEARLVPDRNAPCRFAAERSLPSSCRTGLLQPDQSTEGSRGDLHPAAAAETKNPANRRERPILTADPRTLSPPIEKSSYDYIRMEPEKLHVCERRQRATVTP